MKITTTKTLVATLLLSAFSSFSQVVTDFERVWYNTPDAIEVDDITLSVKNAVSQFDHCKLALTIANESNDYVIFKMEESKFNFEFGEKSSADKELLIKPHDDKTKTMKADGGDKFLQQKFNLNVAGLYRVPTDGKKIEAEDFKLPAAKNSFNAGDFEVVLRKYSASTKEAEAEFECTYRGDDLALVNPTNLSVRATRKKSDEEVVYANDDKKADAVLMRKGDVIKFSAVFHIPGKIVDMQFATMHIVWNDTFVKTKEIPVEAQTFSFEIDEALTREKK